MNDTSDSILLARKVILEDCEVIWQWWNDPVTRSMMKNNDPVPWKQHCVWYENLLKDDSRILCMGLLDNLKIGVVRFDTQGVGVYEVSINMNPQVRGKGLGWQVLKKSIEFMTKQRKVVKFFATFKKTNVPSKRTFEKAGFSISEELKYHCERMKLFVPGKELYCQLEPRIMEEDIEKQ